MNKQIRPPLKRIFTLLAAAGFAVSLCAGCSGQGTEEQFLSVPKMFLETREPLRQNSLFLVRVFAHPEDVTAIGDSVMLGAEQDLRANMPGAVIDAGMSRQVWEGLSIVQELDNHGQLGSTVVIELGTNGVFQKSTAQEIIDYLGTVRTVYWLTAYGKDLDWQEDVNQVIGELAADNDTVVLLDWAGTASAHPEWFYDDGLHLNRDGQKGFAAFIADRVVGPQG